MKRHIVFFAAAAVLAGCCGPHFIQDRELRRQVGADFSAKRAALPDGGLFEVFGEELSVSEREALEFLYAYMPLSDISDYGGDFWLRNVRSSLRTRQEMPWGRDIPDDVFRHFVLPVRVNNEALDSSRWVFYAELKERVEDMSLEEAVLEVNHWCHEKVNYAPSDARTSSPLASVSSATGRCGEESTLTVAALRSVGIPARQVYTPRWAHTDDNHAWVEAWVDGRWRFMGACEPEPVLDLGWFNAPASRGMLMHTKVFGRYDGPEEVMFRTPNYTEINVIDNYAPTAALTVTVLGDGGRPVPGAKVEYKLYNYAEFYSVATKYTGSDGKSSLTAGRGDMLVWASDGGRFGYRKVSFGRDTAVTVPLARTAGEVCSVDFDLTPPDERSNIPEVSPERRAVNDRRFAFEDSVRNAYKAAFMTLASGREFALANGYEPDVLAPVLVASRGNRRQLCGFLAGVESPGMRRRAQALLSGLREKDLRDVSAAVLADHLYSSPEGSGEIYEKYVLCPRVEDEMLTPYKKFFRREISGAAAARFVSDPAELARWCRDSIRMLDTLNSQRVPISPVSVWKSRAADRRSRNIFFVAVARSLGIPSRIDPVTGKLQYVDSEGRFMDVDMEWASRAEAPSGKLRATYEKKGALSDPKYYSHFTVSRFDGGTFRLLSYEEGEASWSSLLRDGAVLDTGYYMLVTGTRLAGGGVLASASFFRIEPGRTTVIPLEVREDSTRIQVIGNFDSEARYMPADSEESCSVLQTAGRGYYAVGVLGVGTEPTNHALRDLVAVADELEEWGRSIVLLFPSQKEYERFRPEEFPGLPSTVSFGVDADGAVRRSLTSGMQLDGRGRLPLLIVGDTFNRVVFFSEGYTIGLGERLLKTIHGL